VSKPAAPPYLVGSGFSLAAVDPGDTGPGNKQAAVEDSDRLRRRLSGLQERLYAEHRRSLLVVLQAIDSSTTTSSGAITGAPPAAG